MAEIATLGVIALCIGVIVAVTAYVLFHVPDIYSVVLGLGAGIMFFFIILWSSYVFIFH